MATTVTRAPEAQRRGPPTGSVRAFLQARPVLSYFALTFLISWGGVLLVIAAGPGRFPATPEEFDPFIGYGLLAMVAGPALAGPLLTGLVEGRAGLRAFASRLLRWRVAGHWYAVALLGATVVMGAAGLLLSAVSADFLPAIFTAEDKLGLVLAGIAGGLAAGVFEELGWTGFATPKLRLRHSLLAAGLILGLVWGVWHFLVYAAGSGTPSGTLSMEVFSPPAVFFLAVLPAFRVLMVWVHDYTASLPVAMLMHASLSSTTVFILAPEVTGAALAAFYLAVAALLWIAVGAVISINRSATPPQ